MRNKDKSITELARELRKNPTPAERKLWNLLRKRRLNGYKFLRQKPIIYSQRNRKRYFFIADFYCAQKKLVIELDGSYHRYQKRYDKNRDQVISKLGIEVLRFSNSEVRNIKEIKSKILNRLEDLD